MRLALGGGIILAEPGAKLTRIPRLPTTTSDFQDFDSIEPQEPALCVLLRKHFTLLNSRAFNLRFMSLCY